MKDNSLNKLGGVCAIVTGVLYLVAIVVYIAQPVELGQHLGEEFWQIFTQSPGLRTVHLAYHAARVAFSLLALAAVLAISEVVRPTNEGWVRWTSILAYLGFIMEAVNNSRAFAFELTQASVFVEGSAIAQEIILASKPLIDVDLLGWLRYATVGLWILVVCVLTLRRGMFPRGTAYVGIVAVILYWFGAVIVYNVALIGNFELVKILCALGGAVATPAWFIWMGVSLLRRKET